MPRSRSRSRSPGYKRERRRSRSRERRRHGKKRSRSRSPRHSRRRSKSLSPRRRSYSPRRSRSRERNSDNGTKAPVIDESKLQGLDDEQIDMMKLMGFATFDTTKGKKVDGNDVSAVNIQRKRRYRQYMNRKGGFNRPLDFIA